MAYLEDAVYSRLSTHAGLVALTSTRIYPMRAPVTAALPLVIYQRVSGSRYAAMGVMTGVAKPRIQVTAWAATYEAARDVSAQVMAALDRWRGTVAGVVIQDSLPEGDVLDLFDEEHQQVGAGVKGAYGQARDYFIPHREA